MSNGAAELHVTEWQAALVRSIERVAATDALEAFFREHLLRAGPGMFGLGLDEGLLAHEEPRRELARVVVEVAQDIVDAAAGSPARESLGFLRTLTPDRQAAWVSWERVLVRWMTGAPPEATLRLAEPLASAGHALELNARLRFDFDRRPARGEPSAEEADLRRRMCSLLLEARGFLGAELVRDELLALADVEESLGQLAEAARHTRKAAELHDDPEERSVALEIAALREAKDRGDSRR